jgi:hypothetical protein
MVPHLAPELCKLQCIATLMSHTSTSRFTVYPSESVKDLT